MFVRRSGALSVLPVLRLIQTSLSKSGGESFLTQSTRDESEWLELPADQPPFRAQSAIQIAEFNPRKMEQPGGIPRSENHHQDSDGHLSSLGSFGPVEDELTIHPATDKHPSEEAREDNKVPSSGQTITDSQATAEEEMIQTPTPGEATEDNVVCRKCGTSVSKPCTSSHVANRHLKQPTYHCIVPGCFYVSRRWESSDVRRHIKVMHNIKEPLLAGKHFADLRRDLHSTVVSELEYCFPAVKIHLGKLSSAPLKKLYSAPVQRSEIRGPTGKNILTCEKCGKSMQPPNIINHVTRHHLKLRCYSCARPRCGFVTSSWYNGNLRMHLTRVHKIANPQEGLDFIDHRRDDCFQAVNDELRVCFPDNQAVFS